MSDHESCPRFYSDASGSRRESDALVHIGFLNELWSHPAEKSSLTPLLQRGKAALAAGGFFPFPQLEPDGSIGAATRAATAGTAAHRGWTVRR